MAQIITVEAADVWGYFQKLRPSPGIMRQLAENPAYGVEIYLTTDATHEGQFLPKILVYLDDDLIHSEICISDADCEHTVASAYERYLSDEVLSLYLDSMEEEYEAMNCDREIEYREADLDAAVYDFLTAVFEDSVDSVFPDMEEADARVMAKELEQVDGVKYVIGLETLLGDSVPEEILPDRLVNTLKSENLELMVLNSEYYAGSDEENQDRKSVV